MQSSTITLTSRPCGSRISAPTVTMGKDMRPPGEGLFAIIHKRRAAPRGLPNAANGVPPRGLTPRPFRRGTPSAMSPSR